MLEFKKSYNLFDLEHFRPWQKNMHFAKYGIRNVKPRILLTLTWN